MTTFGEYVEWLSSELEDKPRLRDGRVVIEGENAGRKPELSLTVFTALDGVPVTLLHTTHE